MAQETLMVSKFLRERPDDSWQYDSARAYNAAYTRLEKAFAMTCGIVDGQLHILLTDRGFGQILGHDLSLNW